MTDIDSIVEGALYTEVKTLKDGKSIVMDPSTERLYYKKVLSVYSVPVFRYLQQHHHKNVTIIKVFWQEEGKLVVIEELIQGKTLDQILDNSNKNLKSNGDKIDFDEKKRILLEICEGLEFLHSANPPIIHRDIKAANIMITDDGTVKIIDYDAAKLFVSNKEKDTVLIGTQGVAAPEQYGFGQSDERTDIYALGKLIQRMLPDSPRALKIAEKATRLEPDARYKTVSEMKSLIEKLWNPEISDSKHFRMVIGNKIRSKTFIVTVIILLLAASGTYGAYYFKTYIYPEKYVRRPAYEAGLEAMKNEKYEEAIKQFGICGEDYENVTELLEECRIVKIKDKYINDAEEAVSKFKESGNSSDARKAIEACMEVQNQGIDNGEMLDEFYSYMVSRGYSGVEDDDMSRTNTVLKVLGEYDFEGLDELKKDYTYEHGLKKYNEGLYDEAVTIWGGISGYKDVDDIINEARYKYVQEHIDSTDGTTKTYIRILKEAGYSGLDQIEQSVNEWNIELKYNYLNESSGDTRLTLNAAGGPTGGKINLKVRITNSSGQTITLENSQELYVHTKQDVLWGRSWNDFGPEKGVTYHIEVVDEKGKVYVSEDKVFE